jgi:hypothetical protein
MNPVLRWLLGLGGSKTDAWSHGRKVLAGVPVGVAALLLAAFVVWTAYNYWRDGRSPGWWVKGPLLLLRTLAVACLLVILLEPVMTWTRTGTQRPTFIVMADTSQSMAIRDTRLPDRLAGPFRRVTGVDPRSAPRYVQTAALLGKGPVRLIERLASKFDVRAYAFAEEAQLIDRGKVLADGARALKPDARADGSTQIGTALRTVLDDNSGRPLAGILLVSDGGSNQGDDPIGWARRARALGIPVSTLGIGDPTPTRDIVLTEALADRVVRKGNEVRAFVGLSHRGYGGSTVTVSLSRNGVPFQSRQVRLSADGAKQTVTFTYTPGQTGEFRFAASVAHVAGETTYQNNARSFLQQVVDKKLRVLYVEGEPRWEYRYLRNAILRDEQIGFACYRTETDGTPTPEGNLPVGSFPSDERALFAYDILIIGDVPRARFQSTHLRAIRRFVEDRGGSLVIIAGERHMPHEYADTLIEPAFPLIVSSAPDQVVMDEPFRWQRTPQGAQDSLLRMSPNPVEDERIWREMPGMLWMAGSRGPKPGATVLAVNPDRSDAAGMRPVLALQPYGAGRCLMVMTDSTWRWRWRVGDRYFYRFWGQMLRTMTPQDNPGGNRLAQLTVDRSECRPGDRVTITARLLDEFYRPSRLPQLTASLTGPLPLSQQASASAPGPSRTVTLLPAPGSPGLYTAGVIAGTAGEYRVTLTSAAGGPPVSARFLVQQVSLEAQQPEMREDALRRIAAESGGRFLRAEEAAAWADGQKPRNLTVRTVVETPLWNAPIGLIAAVGLLSLEWLVRRRVGMA